MTNFKTIFQILVKPFATLRNILAISVLACLTMMGASGTAQANIACPIIENQAVIANANSQSCSTSAAIAVPSVIFDNEIGLSFNFHITPNVGVVSPVTATCTGGGCIGSPTGGTVGCDSTSQPCNITYSFLDANGDTVSGSLTAPPYGFGGATLTAHTISGGVFTPDIVAPTLTSVSIASNNATSSEKGVFGDTITLTLVSDEALVTGPTVSIAGQAATVTGSGTSWNATISVAQFPTEGNAAISISAFADAAGNVGTTVTSTTDGSSVDIDTTKPRVSSISRSSPTVQQTNADSVTFRMIFNEPVTNVAARDFAIIASPATTAAITTMNVVNSTTVDLTVSGGDLANYNGQLRVGVASSDAIQDLAGNNLLTTNPITSAHQYNFDNVGPGVFSIARRIPNTEMTANDTLQWEITFTASGAGFDRSSVGSDDFTISGASGTTTSISDGPGATDVRVQISGGDLADLNAVVTLGFAPGATILDTLGNNIASTVPTDTNNNSYTVQNDFDAPSLTTVTIASNNTSPDLAADGDVITVTMQANETLGTPPTVTIAGLPATVAGGGSNWTATVTLPTPPPVGNAAINITAYADAAGNVGTPITATTNMSSVTIGQLPDAPTNLQIDRFISPAPAFAGQAHASTLTEVDLRWTENGLNGSADQVFSPYSLRAYGNGTCSGVAGDNSGFNFGRTSTNNLLNRTTFPEGSTVSYNLRVSNNFGEGQPSNCVSFVVPALDNTAPTVTTITRGFSGPGQIPETTDLDVVSWFVQFSEDVMRPRSSDFSVSGTTASITVSSVDDSNYEISVHGGDLATANGRIELSLAPAHSVKDTAGNALVNATPSGTNNNFFIMDNDVTAPRIASITRNAPLNERTFESQLVFNVTFNETVNNVTADDFEVSGTTGTASIDMAGGDTYQIRVSGGDLSTLDGTVSLGLAAGQDITDTAGNAAIQSMPNPNEVFIVDNTRPELVSMVRQTPMDEFTNADSLTWRVTFNEPIGTISANAFSIQTTTATPALTAVSSTVYDVTFSGGDLADIRDGSGAAGALTFVLSTDVARVLDLAGHRLASALPANGRENFTVSNQKPVLLEIRRRSPEQTRLDSVAWTVSFDSNDTDLEIQADDLTLTGTTGALTVTKNFTRNFEVTAAGGDLADLTGTITLSLNPGLTDRFGNVMASTVPTLQNQNSYNIDNTRPTPVISTISTNPVAGAFPITVSFDEDVRNFTLPDIRVTNGTRSNFTQVSPSVYTATITPDADGEVRVNLPENLLTDAVGNGNVAAAEFLITNDTTNPRLSTILRNNPVGETTNADQLNWLVTFTEDVTNVDASDFAINGTTANLSIVPSMAGPDQYFVTASGGNLADLSAQYVSIELAGGQNIQDLGGRALINPTPVGANERYSVSNDMLKVASIRRADVVNEGRPSEITNADVLGWDIQFSGISPQFALTPADLTLTGTTGTITSVTRYSIGFLVRAEGGDLANLNGTVTLGFSATTPVDEFGNQFTDKVPSGVSELSYQVDNTVPTVLNIFRGMDGGATIPETTDLDTVRWRVQFSEGVGQFTPRDIEISGTTAAAAITRVNNDLYELSLSGGDLNNLNGDVEFNIATRNSIRDFAGNAMMNVTPSGANDNSFRMLNDADRPTLTITSDVDGSTAGPFTVLFTFSEDVLRFDARDVSVGNGSISNFSLISASEYSATITPAGDGTVTVDVGEAAANDRAGNGNAAANTLTINVDRSAPTASLSTPPTSVNGPFDLIFSFSEDMSGLTADDFNVENATLSLSGGPQNFTLTITPNGTGDISLNLPAGAATDPAGNGNEAFSATFSVGFDDQPPTVTTSTPPETANGPFDLVFSFSEDMTGLTADDFNVENATVTLSGGPRDFTVTITPDGNGNISIGLPAGAATDPAGNGNDAFNTSIEIEFDDVAPDAAVSTPPDIVNGPFDLVLSFSEDMSGLTANDFNVENAAVTISGGPRDFILTITPDGDGPITVNLPASSATDPAGNGNKAFNFEIDVDIDTEPPATTLSVAETEVMGPFILTITFSEAVIGFSVDDLIATNATLSEFSGADTVFTVLVSPETVGEIALSLSEGAASDPAGNLSTAAQTSVNASAGEVTAEIDVTISTSDASSIGTDFSLSNPGSQPIFFAASSDQVWVDVSPESGQIDSLSNIEFDIQLNDRVNDLAPGTYVATVTVEVVDGPSASAASKSSLGPLSNENTLTRNILAEVPITVEVEERFGNFELVVLTPTGPAQNSSFEYSSDIGALDGLAVLANEGERRIRVDDLIEGTYRIEQSLLDGYVLERITCSGDQDGGTIVDLDNGVVDLDLDASEQIVCIFENRRDDAAIRIATQRAIRNFMARRGDRVLEAAPDLSNRFVSRSTTEGGQFSASGSEFRTNMDFQTSLSGFRNRAAEDDKTPSSGFTPTPNNQWDLWASAEYTRYDDERVDSGIDGKFFAAQFGADYLITPKLIIGAFVQYDWMSERDKERAPNLGATAGAQVNGEGLMAGPYLVWKAQEQLTIDVMGLWGSSDNEVNPLGYYTDEFETDRFLVQANVTGEFTSGAWRVRPQVSLAHYEDKQDAYVDSLGIDIPEQTISIGRLRAGPEVVWTHLSEGGSRLELGGSIRAVWNYNGAGLMDPTGLISGGSDPVRADGDLSLATVLPNGIQLRTSVGFDGITQGRFSARSGRLEFVFPFGGKGGDASVKAPNTFLLQDALYDDCKTDGFLQSRNLALPSDCTQTRQQSLLDTHIAMMGYNR